MEKIYSLRYRLLLFFVFLSNWVFAQTGVITGQVVDEGNVPLPAVTVVVKGTAISTGADINGNFRLTNVPSGSQTLVVSFIGYKNLERVVEVNGTVNVSLQMEPSSMALNEVAVIGYGTIRKSDATGALGVVTAKDFNRGAVNTIQDAIVGKLAGVVITSNSGAPGNTSTIRIRGGGSLDASSDPLLVIDNVPVDNYALGGSANILTIINPNDIENITVLKDASATAIYGARASNGVLLITTKRGSKETKINYNALASLSVLPKHVDVYTGDEFREVINKVYGSQPLITSLLSTDNTDWQNEIYRKAFGQDHNLSVSGMAKNLPYRVALGYNNSDGVLKTYNFQRTTLAIGVDPSLFDKHLNIHINVKGLYNLNNFAEQGAIGNAISYDPTKPVRNGNTHWRGYTTWTSNNNIDINGAPVTLGPANPVAQLELTDNKSTVRRSIGNAQFDYKMHFLPELHANLNLGYDYTKVFGHNNVPDSTGWVYIPIVGGGKLSNYEENRKNQLVDFYLNYAKDLKSIESNINVTAGYSWSHFSREGKTTSSDAAMISPQPVNNYFSDYYLISFFGRLNYSYKDKYLLTFTVRDDATSRFAPDQRWGLFPAGAFTWKIKEEGFLKNSSAISDLKLRVGYGVTGQQDLRDGNNYPALAKFTLSDGTSRYRLGDSYYNTLRPDGYDANIKWETATTTNIGLDYGFMNGRLTGSIDVYYRKTKDLLSVVDAAAGTNFAARVLTNIGNMENRGIEFSLNAALVSKKDFNWQLGYNISYNKNKITRVSINPNTTVIGVGGIAGTFDFIQAQKVGSPSYSYYVFQQIYDSNGKPIEDAYVDRNNDNVINSADLYIYQNPAPTVLMGINSRVNYKRWDFSFSGRLSLGNYNYNNVAAGSTYKGLYSSLGFIANQTKAAEETQFLQALKTNKSDFYIQNASFFRMDNINLGYSFPDIKKLKLRLNAGVQNAFIITKYKGLDPEIQGGLDNNFFPRARIYQLGLNCTF